MAMAKLEMARTATRMLGAEISTATTGLLFEIDHLSNCRVRLTIDVLVTERPVLRYASDRVRLMARKVPDEVVTDAAVTGYVPFMPPFGTVRPGSYDFSFEAISTALSPEVFMKRRELALTTQLLSTDNNALASIENVRDRIA